MLNYDRLVFEQSVKGRKGYSLLNNTYPSKYQMADLGAKLRLKTVPLPELSELDVVRHYTLLSQKNFGVETGFYPLGSCTMKYNPKINEELAALPGFTRIHPLQYPSSIQGTLKIYRYLSEMLSEIVGMDAFTLNPFAGAHGELTGLMIMKQYHLNRQDFKRTKVIVPDAAHGTNPASSAVAGMDIIEIPSTASGLVDIEQLKAVLNDDVAGMMLTNPNTLGIFDRNICEICRLVHEAGGLMYYDGANLNALLGQARPGDMGFDIVHVNLHKTFSTPHGGGGPGSGPVGVKKKLAHLLPGPQVKETDGFCYIETSAESIGRVSGFFGNTLVWIRAYAYILTLGKENIKQVGELATINANYVKESLKDDYLLPIEGPCMHECVFDGLLDKSTNVTTLDIAKRLLDFGYHAPTIYFPLLFHQSIMIEPTETESKQTLDDFIAVMKTVAKEAKEHPDIVKEAPHATLVSRIDEVYAAKKMILTYQDYLEENAKINEVK
ncbi:MAG: aminomethyl-transferring glycine dehydrogenase subunit GcvPB [Candidatus Izemoplasmatales bacterium]|jgi:glycine dehydrogenase subunit 2|nr:aminomethyl-transferring glycine dehydrogenase subunit GcvPB [Candidatus Izemoplasmatales bacterium]